MNSRDALVFDGRRWSWSELEAEIAEWAGRLVACEVGQGDRVAVISPNRAELVPLFHAAGRLGAIWAPLNARLTAGEASPLLRRLRPALVVVDESLVDLAPGAMSIGELARKTPRPFELPALSPERTRALLFTSGTSGRPKAVEITEASFEASARASGENLGAGADQRWLACMPLFHIGGLAMVHRCGLYSATLVLQPRFDAEQVTKALTGDRITHASLVPTGLARLLEASSAPAPVHLGAVLVGGGPMSADLLSKARGRGFRVLQTYGLTEACSQVTTEGPGSGDGASAGAALPGTEVRIVDDAGRTLLHGEVGEIEVRGPTVMRGYFGDADANAEAFRDGWFRTRDLGTLDEKGRLRILSRRTDLIVSGGENVYPAEVEGVLAEHPGILEVGVVGVEDPDWGQIPVALWAARDRGCDEESLRTWGKGRLAGFKIPRRFLRVDALPRTGSGKVDRAGLRTLAINTLQMSEESRKAL